MSEADFIFKISIIGNGEVGKTSLIQQYTHATFQNAYIKTIGAQFSTYNEEIDGYTCKLTLWDIAGQDDHFFLRPAFYKGSSLCIIVFSLENSDHGKESIKSITAWKNDIQKYCGKIPIVLFGNKADLVDENDRDEESIQKLIKKQKFLYWFKTSAKTGEGLIQGFHAILKSLIEKREEGVK